jgi:hypothetical protein
MEKVINIVEHYEGIEAVSALATPLHKRVLSSPALDEIKIKANFPGEGEGSTVTGYDDCSVMTWVSGSSAPISVIRNETCFPFVAPG